MSKETELCDLLHASQELKNKIRCAEGRWTDEIPRQAIRLARDLKNPVLVLATALSTNYWFEFDTQELLKFPATCYFRPSMSFSGESVGRRQDDLRNNGNLYSGSLELDAHFVIYCHHPNRLRLLGLNFKVNAKGYTSLSGKTRLTHSDQILKLASHEQLPGKMYALKDGIIQEVQDWYGGISSENYRFIAPQSKEAQDVKPLRVYEASAPKKKGGPRERQTDLWS